MAEVDQTFTAGEIGIALEGLQGLNPDQRDQVFAALGGIAAEKIQLSETERRQSVIQDMAKAYRRSSGSDSNIEGWTEDLYEAALEHLYILKDIEADRQTEIDVAARNAAATMVFIMDSQRGEELKQDLFSSAGVDMGWFTGHLRDGFIAGLKIQEEDILSKWLPELDTLEDMARFGNYWGRAWEETVEPLADSLIQQIEASGVELPVLGDDGLYNEEREEWED